MYVPSAGSSVSSSFCTGKNVKSCYDSLYLKTRVLINATSYRSILFSLSILGQNQDSAVGTGDLSSKSQDTVSYFHGKRGDKGHKQD